MSKHNQALDQALPKIARQRLYRMVGILFAVAIGLFAFNYYRLIQGDLGGLQRSDTFGMISAVQFLDDGGSEAVIFKPDGSVLRNGGYKAGSTERDLTWSPDGNFLYFVSDREEGTFNVFRWAPRPNRVESRTLGRRGRSNPSFSFEDVPGRNETALIVSGGLVQEFSPKDASTRTVLPPPDAEIALTVDPEAGGAGATSALKGVYGRYGESFRLARWFMGKTWVAGIMRRDEGEVLLAQSLERDSRGDPVRPIALVAGNRIDIDVNPKTGALIYSVQGFQWPSLQDVPESFRKDGKITTPFRHGILIFEPREQKDATAMDLQKAAAGETSSGPIALMLDDETSFGFPRVSPNGEEVLMTVGEYDPVEQALRPRGLVSIPARVGGAGASVTRIVQGEIYEPSWSADGNTIVFARREEGGRRAIVTIAKDGSSERVISGTDGNFGTPLYSPQSRPASP